MATKTPSTAPEPVAEAPEAQQPAPLAAPEPAAVPTATTNGLSITSLVLAITGILLAQGWLSVAAIVFGFIGRAKEPSARTIANWGVVLGFVGLFGGLILAITGLALLSPFFVWGAIGPWDIFDIGAWDVWDR